jgi:uncharacterized protein (DUF4415 family)
MSASNEKSGFDAAKFDAHVITQEEYDEAPELTDEMLARGQFYYKGEPVKRGRGRPPGSDKQQMNLRIDIDVIEAYRASGDGWQTRMNEALREYAKNHGMLAA